MKKIIIAVILTSLYSCGKKGPTPNPADNGNLSYKLKGINYSYTNVSAFKNLRQGGYFGTHYDISGFDRQSNSTVICIFTQSDTLKEQSYHLAYATVERGSDPAFFVGSNTYYFITLDKPQYYIDLVITSYKNGYVSGTFSGKVVHVVSLNPEVDEDGDVTEGRFTNLKVFY